MHSILIVDDEENVLKSLSRLFRSSDYNVQTFSDPLDALQQCLTHHFDLVITDQRMPSMFGVNFLENLMQVQPETRRILISGYSDFEDVVEAFNSGVIHKFIVKPWDNDILLRLVEHQLELKEGKRRRTDHDAAVNDTDKKKKLVTDSEFSRIENFDPAHPDTELVEFHGIMTADADLKKQLKLITSVAKSDAPFYVNGETGTGKELIARAIHEEGRRKDGPFVAINCANLTKDLLESQLFGHKKGAFTGANTNQVGLLATADGGTLFLDEVVEIPMELQAKLLRVLQEKEFTPIGETRPVSFNCQIISASALSLADAVEQHAFRDDLRFRLEVITILLSPLRKRGADVKHLFSWLLDKEIMRQGIEISKIDQEVYDQVYAYNWPGNIREMINVCTYIVAMSTAFGGIITIECLPGNIIGSQQGSTHPQDSSSPRKEGMQKFDSPVINRETLISTLEKAAGNRSKAANLLGVSRMTLYRKLKEFDLE